MLMANYAGVRYNRTPSLPGGFYSERAYGGVAAEVGDLVMFCLPPDVTAYGMSRGYLRKGGCPGGASPLGKAVIAVAGDTVVVGASSVAVNGREVPHSEPLREDSRGRAIAPGYGEVVLEEGQVFVLSNYHGRSFDSRYYGPVEDTLIRGKLMPILTWGNDWEDDLTLVASK